jgi:hypothetical protein
MAYEAQISRTNPAAFLFVNQVQCPTKCLPAEARLSLSPMLLIEL